MVRRSGDQRDRKENKCLLNEHWNKIVSCQAFTHQVADKFYNHIQNSCEMILKAFQMGRITPIIKLEIPDEDPFKNIQHTQ